MISTVDPQARHAHKTVHRRQDGFKAHLAVEPDTGLVTACQLTKAAGPDSADAVVGVDLLTAETEHLQVLGDSAYGTGEALATLTETGHLPLVKPWPIKPAVPGGFTVDDFHVDLSARTVTCPAGNTVPINPTGAARFGSRCTGCPLASQCTTARRGRDVHISQHFDVQHEHRQRAQDPGWQDSYRQHRPMVERSIAWLTARGNRKLRYRGVGKNNAWLHHRTAALNLRRLLDPGPATAAGSLGAGLTAKPTPPSTRKTRKARPQAASPSRAPAPRPRRHGPDRPSPGRQERYFRSLLAGASYLDGDVWNNVDDATRLFPRAQGAVLVSRSELDAWASPVTKLEREADWCLRDDTEVWLSVVRTERLTTGFPLPVAYGVRRARRLNACVPPSV